MTAPRSLQWRLAFWVGLGVSALWIAAALVTAAVIRDEVEEVFDSALQETAQRLLPLAVLDIVDRQDDEGERSIMELHEHEEYFTYLVRDARGRVLLRSHNADQADFPPYPGNGFRRTDSHVLYFDSALSGSVTIAVAEPLHHRAEVSREILVALALPLLLLLPLSLLGIWFMVRRSLAPVRGFGAAIATRGSADLSPVAPGELPAEIRPIADAVNALMDRVRQTLEAERSFTANAAHELRTPVAAALAQVQRLEAETGDAATKARAGEIETALKRLTRLSEKLMQLARAEGALLRGGTPHDVAPVVRLVAEDLHRAGNGEAGRLALQLPDRAVMSDIDPDALAILLRNLIENALIHGDPQAPVEVTLDAAGRLSVVNGGPVVPRAQLAALGRRFTRGATRADGSGLGLSIAAAIAQGAGGRLELQSPAPGRQDGFAAVFEPGPQPRPETGG